MLHRDHPKHLKILCKKLQVFAISNTIVGGINRKNELHCSAHLQNHNEFPIVDVVVVRIYKLCVYDEVETFYRAPIGINKYNQGVIISNEHNIRGYICVYNIRAIKWCIYMYIQNEEEIILQTYSPMMIYYFIFSFV